MKLFEAVENLDPAAMAEDMLALMARLFPICRSITGEGVRATLRAVGERIPLQMQEVASGTPVLDWSVPKEWNIRDAWVKGPDGRKVIDFAASNLHVVNYSIPVRQTLSLEALKPHLFTLPDHPDWIPYRTSYYREDWGFCLSHRQLLELLPGDYEVCIDSTLREGSLTYGECRLPGESESEDDGEILISTHVCHPSLANDNLSGIAAAVTLADLLSRVERRHRFRFLFIPGTIGSITWLSRNESQVPHIRHGLVLTGLGNPGLATYKRSRRGDAEIDLVAAHVLARDPVPGRLIDFFPYGYDERQYCSPGFDMPVGRLTRTPHGEYPEYHTSADHLTFVRKELLADSVLVCARILAVLEENRRYLNLQPKGEPQLGRRGLYGSVGGMQSVGVDQMALLWVLNLCDGRHTLLDIAERANMPFATVLRAKNFLVAKSLLAETAEKMNEPAGAIKTI